MNKTKVLMVLFALFLVPVMMFADFREYQHRIEFGPSVGFGFYVGPSNPVSDNPNILRVQKYDFLAYHKKGEPFRWPGIETFGFNVGYRFDSRWKIVANTVRQRLSYYEYDESVDVRGLYYNAMWHVDVMAEYNLLTYGDNMVPNQKIYTVVPYIGFGIGCTMFNENATLRDVNYGGASVAKFNTYYPQVGKDYQGDGVKPIKNEIAVGLYIPVAFGVKWRVSENVQLKGSFQYQLYLSNKLSGSGLNSNLDGASAATYYATKKQEGVVADKIDQSIHTRPTFDQLDKHIIGHNHDCLFSISAIFNISRWYQSRLVD